MGKGGVKNPKKLPMLFTMDSPLQKKHPTFRFNLIDKATLFPSADKNAT